MTLLNRCRTCWLFQKAGEALSGSKRTIFYLWNRVVPLLFALGTGLLSLLLAYGRYSTEVFKGYFTHPMIAALNLLPPMILYAILYCLIGRAWIAHLVESLLVLILSAANFFMLLFRDDPLMFADLLDAQTGLGVAGKYNLSINRRLALCVAFVVLSTVFLAFLVRGRSKWLPRLIALVALALICIFPLRFVYASSEIYDNRTKNYDAIDRWSATQTFLSRGYVYPFLHSISSAFPKKPDGYDAKEVETMLNAYSDTDIPEDKKVNVVSLMLESFADLSDWDIPGLSPDVYDDYHALEAESYSGTLVDNIFAGGTTNTERCFLTGLGTLENFRRDTNSYVWYLQSQGYRTDGSHPCYEYFYNRSNINQYLGFEDYLFLENHYGELADGYIAYDDVFFPEMLRLLQEDFENGASFSYNLTYQGHGPYSTDTLKWPECVENVGYSDEAWYILNNYFGSVKNTCEHLTELTQGLEASDEPVVLVVFGDHKPWLGDANSVYQELGINLDTGTEEGFYNYYSTRYLIWANSAAKEVLGNDFTGEGPTVSPTFLMNLLFEQCGWKGSAWMQYTDTVREILPVITSNGFYVTADGTYTTVLTDEQTAVLSKFRCAEYWYRRNFIYQDTGS